MEDFRTIADETFPSFFGNSLSSSTSVMFENVTISSNPGLPVAASTVAKSKTGCDNRLSDVQASYLEEGRRSLPSGSSLSIQSDPEPVGRFALSFQDDVEVVTQIKEPQPTSVSLKESHSVCGEEDQNVMEHSNHSQDTLLEVLPLERLEDLSTGICFLPGSKNNKVGAFEPSEKLIEGEVVSEHLSTSLSSFLENEKLSSLASLEGDSTDDDIDDEEFFDNQLEAYFEQLVPPEMTRGDTNMQEFSECCTALKLSENSLLRENFQVPGAYQAVTGGDPGTTSDEDSQKQGITGCPVQRETLLRAVQQLNSMTGGDVLDSCSAFELKLDSLYLQCMDSDKADVLGALPKQEIKSSECQVSSSDAEILPSAGGFLEYYTTPKIPLSASAAATDANSTECDVGLADTYLSPTADSCEDMCLTTKDKGDIPHSIVYQNEEGKWVTDLAYYTSFDEEQDLNLSEDDKINEEFITGSEAAAMIAQDQEEFEKAHRLVQAEKVDFLNASELADSSWKSANSCILLRTSDLNKDASYLRLSLGEFFGQRSEALGCLGGGSDVKRPSFGYHITSPKKRQPVALLSQSDASGGYAGQETSQFSEVFPDDLGAHIKEHANSANCENGWRRMEAAAGIHKSFTTETATKSKAKDGIHKGKLEDSSSDHSDSVLSISTIASAIANASASTDPSQLAAMMMALSNKNKKKCFLLGIVKDMELSTNGVSSSNVENSAFDMEKYLKKTDEMGHESEYESIVKHEASVQNFLYDSFLVDENKNQDTLAEDLLNNHNKQQEIEKQFVDYFHEEGGIQDFSCPSSVPKDEGRTANSANCSEKLSDLINGKHSQSVRVNLVSDMLDTPNPSAGNGARACGTPLATKMEVAHRGQFGYQTNVRSSRCYSREDAETVDQVTDAVPEPCNGLVKKTTGNTTSLSNLNLAKQSSTYMSVSPTKAKPVQKLNNLERKQGGKTPKRNKDAGAACSGNVKHVTFEKFSMTYQNSSEHKSALPECDLQSSEDEQCSFRPSTSPLIHSSPSDTSGTTFSGSETDFISTSRCQKSCNETVLPQSVYSSPSMSRLTYISASDSTLKNTAIIHNPEMCWSENASELSTTIIQASPTPSLEHENLKDYLCQRNRKGTQFIIDQKSEEKEPLSLKSKLESEVLGEKLSKEGFPTNENQVASNPSNVTSNHKELDHVKSALPSKPCIFQPLSDNVDKPEVWQDHTSNAQRPGLPSLNVLPIYPGLSTYIPLNQNSSDEQYVPISSFKSHVTASESQTSSSVPTLLTGRSLATTPFAQQHLGKIPSTGSTALSQFHGSSSAGFGLPGGLPGSGIPAGHVQNPVTLGIPLGPNIGPGSLGAASLCNLHSAWNKNILNIKSYTGQPFGVGRNEWELSVSPGFGHVKVPEELKFPNACCVGIASQTTLSIFNPTERWLQVSVGIISTSVNGEKMDPVKYQCLVFKNKTIVGPHSTDDLKILFLPCHSGIFQCILSIASWPVSADAETVVQAEALASRVILTAVAENPNIEVETGKTDCLDFGDLASGSWKALPLKLINKTHAFVPIRLIINANAVAWRCFTFSKEPVNPSNEHSFQMDAVSQIAAPSVVNHVIHASYDGQDPEALTVWVLFHAPKKQISSSDTLGPADEFSARVDVEVDSPGPSSVIKNIPLRARAGTARIHAPKDLQTICLSASVGSSSKRQLPLKNAGNIGVYLKIKTSDQDSCFSVEPEDLSLLPGEEREVAVLFFPKNLKTAESTLKILVLPSGPQYEVVLKGEVENMENRPVSTAAACTDIPPILSNKQFIAWGGVTLGRSVQQKLTLRNNSLSVTQHLRLLIRGQDQDCFQLQSIFGTEERLTSNWELKIRPREDTNIYLKFAPTRITCMFAKLEIKQLGVRSQPGIKFTIPLSGYGGTSNIILENVKKLSDNYMITLNGLLPARLRKVSFRMRNTGSRAAYVRALCFADLETKTVMDPHAMTVSPERFVLKEGTHEVITVTWNPVEKEKNFHKTKMLSAICFFWGDEISRQQYRRAMMCNPQVAKYIVPENSLLRNMIFDEEFQGEQLVTEVYDIPRRANDVHLFYGNMRKVILSVVGYSIFDQDDFQQYPQCHLESDRFANSIRHMNATLDVLPVKGPQGPPLPVKTDDIIQNKLLDQQTWAVKPEYLILTSPSISGRADTGHVQIINNSNRMLTFELSWPAHCLTITPQHGNIEPESSILILVSPNPSLATKPSVIPWSGLIYIHCDNGQKFIKVQIRDAVAQDASEAGSPSRKLDAFTLQSENPITYMAKPLSMPPLTKMEIKNRTVVFPKTRSGESSESYLEMENKGDENLKWHLSSFAPPYVKDVDESGHVYRVTYSAFRCSCVSGTLEAHREEKVALIFLPRDRGDYSQFWDLECYPVEKPYRKHKLRFQLSGAGTKTENKTLILKASTDALTETELPPIPGRKAYSEASTVKTGQNGIIRGLYAPEDLYTFPPTRVGESRTLKVNLRNNSFMTHLLKFVSPREPFHIKHLKYSLRSHHYINVPVQFKPKAEGRYEALLVVQTNKYGTLGIRLCGKAIAKE
nr:PREDICTED: centrosomal protein of 192 kDa [Apteryx mantelli mantelli]